MTIPTELIWKKKQCDECKNIIITSESYNSIVLLLFSALFEIINPISKAPQHVNNDLH